MDTRSLKRRLARIFKGFSIDRGWFYVNVSGELFCMLQCFEGPKPAEIRQMLLELRQHCGWTQAYLASVLGVPKVTLRRWESSERNPCGTARKLIWLVHHLVVLGAKLQNERDIVTWGKKVLSQDMTTTQPLATVPVRRLHFMLDDGSEFSPRSLVRTCHGHAVNMQRVLMPYFLKLVQQADERIGTNEGILYSKAVAALTGPMSKVNRDLSAIANEIPDPPPEDNRPKRPSFLPGQIVGPNVQTNGGQKPSGIEHG
jgi:DNA-binding XRE family transcriptional regulator